MKVIIFVILQQEKVISEKMFPIFVQIPPIKNIKKL